MGPERSDVEWAPGRVTTSVAHPAAGRPPVVLAHGAGAGQDHPLVRGLATRLASAGLPILSFDYPYLAEGRRRPDRPDVLMACHRAMVALATERFGTEPVVAGRSMGGRIGTMLAAEEAPGVAAVVAYAYPLHPPGKPDRLRVEHLPAIEVPVLMVVGDRDAFVTAELYDEHVRPLPLVTTHVLAGADHSWRVPKATGRTTDDVLDEAVAATVTWLAGTAAG